MMIRTGASEEAQRMIALQGELFRYALEFDNQETVTLEQEWKTCEIYLALQKFRFQDRLEVFCHLGDDTLKARVPTLMLQPIVENAVIHGVERTSESCRVDVHARRQGETLVIEIINDAEPDSIRNGHGIGVTNTHARLQKMYGERAAFQLVRDGRRVTATLSLPVIDGEA
jgi:LytS/YehU family sensor histidine kinase